MILSGWIVLGLFGLLAVAIFVVGNVLQDNIDNHQTFDTGRHNDLIDMIDRLDIGMRSLESRIESLEKPYTAPAVETKVCPECNEEKDVVEGDYICKECRNEPIAA